METVCSDHHCIGVFRAVGLWGSPNNFTPTGRSVPHDGNLHRRTSYPISDSALPGTSLAGLDPLFMTATYIVARATQSAPASPIPARYQTQTVTALQTTRTAIALTRNPSLAISPTPNAIQLTATQIIENQVTTSMVTAPPVQTEQVYLTVTAIIARATQSAETTATANPTLALTQTAQACAASIQVAYQDDLARQIAVDLAEAGFDSGLVGVIAEGVGARPECEIPFRPLHTRYFVQLNVGSSFQVETDRANLADYTATILAILSHYPSSKADGPEPARLSLVFPNMIDRYLETGYANALAAYDEGLRGAALLEALGGILELEWLPDLSRVRFYFSVAGIKG